MLHYQFTNVYSQQNMIHLFNKSLKLMMIQRNLFFEGHAILKIHGRQPLDQGLAFDLTIIHTIFDS